MIVADKTESSQPQDKPPKTGIAEIIGPPRTKLTRIRDKAIRAVVESNLHSDTPPEILLRGYLALSKRPPEALLDPSTIMSTLTISDCFTYLNQLSVRRQQVDSAAVISSVAAQLRQNPSLLSSSILMRLNRLASMWLRRNTAADPDSATISKYLETALLIVGASPTRQFSGTKNSSQKHLIALVRYALAVGASYGGILDIHTLLALVTQSERQLHIDFNADRSEDHVLADALDRFSQRIFAEVQATAERGDTTSLSRLTQQLLDTRYWKSITLARLDDLRELRAQYSYDVQELLARMSSRDQPTDAPFVFHADPAVSQTTLQLAVALLRAWDARTEGPLSAEAFQTLQSVLRDFFGLRLRGTQGETVTFNPRTHETADGRVCQGTAQLIRPFVEFTDNDISHVIVKGLVACGKEG